MTILKNNDVVSVDDELEKLFSNSPIETKMPVDLPSKGKFYKGFKGASVTPLLYEDEQRILLARTSDIDPVDEILFKCVQGVHVDDLLSMDKIYLLLKIKEVSYGPEYKFSVVCPACKESGDITLDVSKHITINYIPDDLQDPREVHLPVLNVKATVRFPRNSELHYLANWEDSLNNTYRFVESVNGIADPIFISKALQKMHIRDRKVIINEINKSNLGVDPKFQYDCGNCGHNSVMGVPFTASFFSVS